MKIEKYSFNDDQLILLKNNIKNKIIKKKINKESNRNEWNKKNHIIYFSTIELNIILDELTYLFTEKGIEENSEPNDLGLLIEEIIDVFSKNHISDE